MTPSPAVAVTGATGKLGRLWVADRLRADPELHIYALVRHPRAAAGVFDRVGIGGEERARLHWVAADLTGSSLPETVERIAPRITQGWWHFAACTNLANDASAAHATMEVNVRGTERLLAALQRYRDPGPFYHVSTAYVAGTRPGWIDEQALGEGPFRNPYEASKAMAERLVQAYFMSGKQGLVFRPSIVLGSGADPSFQLPELCARALHAAEARGERALVVRLPEDAELDLVSEDWVVACLVALAAGGRSGTTYHVTASRRVRVRDFVEILARRSGGLHVQCDPMAAVTSLSAGARLLDRLLEPVRAYFGARQWFDRRLLLRDLPSRLHESPLNLERFLGQGAPQPQML